MEPETWQNGLLWTTAGQILSLIGGLLSSGFGIALAGAGFGAFGAGLVTKKLKDFDDRMLEFRQTNAAIGICGTICNAYLMAKDQYVKPLHTNFYNQLTSYEEGNVAIEFDFQQFQQEPVAANRLQDLIFENLATTNTVLHVTITLIIIMDNVANQCKQRNDFIERWDAWASQVNNLAKTRRYLGKPHDDRIDVRYISYVDHLWRNVDDCIFYSELLQKMLRLRAVKSKKELEKRTMLSMLRKPKVPNVGWWDFTDAKAKGMFPDPTEYTSILAGLGLNQSGESTRSSDSSKA